MYKLKTIEEIAEMPCVKGQENVSTITMLYDHINDEIILNSSYEHYDTCVKLVENYLVTDEEHRERLKSKLKFFKEETTLLDKIIEIRNINNMNNPEWLKQQYAKEFKMMGTNKEFWKHLNILEIIGKASRPDFRLIDAFTWGYIQGKRAERARRKKVSHA